MFLCIKVLVILIVSFLASKIKTLTTQYISNKKHTEVTVIFEDKENKE